MGARPKELRVDMEANGNVSAPSGQATPDNVVQELLALTSGSTMDRERMAVQVRDLLMNTPVASPEDRASQQGSMPWKCLNLSLPKFIGYEDTQTPKEFLEKLEMFCSLTGVPQDKRLRQVLPAALEGTAKLWWKFTGGFDNWESFVQEFQSEFASVDYKHRLKEELERRTQHPQENLKHFIHVIAEFYDRIGEPVPDHEKVLRVRRQMHPKFQDLSEHMVFANLQEMAKAAGSIMERAWHRLRYVPPPSKGDQAAKDLAFVEHHDPSTKVSAVPCTQTAVTATPGSQQEWPLHPTAVLASYRDQAVLTAPTLNPWSTPWCPPVEPVPTWPRSAGQECQRCGGVGHAARHCATGRPRNQRRCYRCNQTGHIQANCPGNGQS